MNSLLKVSENFSQKLKYQVVNFIRYRVILDIAHPYLSGLPMQVIELLDAEESNYYKSRYYKL